MRMRSAGDSVRDAKSTSHIRHLPFKVVASPHDRRAKHDCLTASVAATGPPFVHTPVQDQRECACRGQRLVSPHPQCVFFVSGQSELGASRSLCACDAFAGRLQCNSEVVFTSFPSTMAHPQGSQDPRWLPQALCPVPTLGIHSTPTHPP
ncbi:uncharacterized protein BCR38DRAFT_432523 [Pseudomassariella vexata]|uniref:Uncharacterized protein n=1 Tax=Pseudomassariella vexata TaxID=1141098 RepID=A0A1Y2E1E2_9PEZI|nr:uncharacterized protein BCR38DRAFT_432523 [Pseudomassariella vexata]ORY65352.1 hypothetical protein BCR38DRAFT_432523 [Pseudomassariella vexata]